MVSFEEIEYMDVDFDSNQFTVGYRVEGNLQYKTYDINDEIDLLQKLLDHKNTDEYEVYGQERELL